MERKKLNSTSLRAAAYDATAKRLELEFANGTVKIFKAVPNEVFRRLLAAPNPAAYYEDRIAEEYAYESGGTAAGGDAKSRLDSLFGPPKSES